MMTRCRRIGDGVFVLILALTLWGCNKVSPEMKPYMLPGASAPKEAKEGSGERMIHYHVKLDLPGNEQLNHIANAGEWTPLKADALLDSTSSMAAEKSLFLWLDTIDQSKKSPLRVWHGEWRNKQDDFLEIRAFYNPQGVKGNAVQAIIHVTLFSQAALRATQERTRNWSKNFRRNPDPNGPPLVLQNEIVVEDKNGKHKIMPPPTATQ